MIDFVVSSSNLRPRVLDARGEERGGAVNRPPPGGESAPVVGEDAGKTRQNQTYCEGLLRTPGRIPCQKKL